MRGKLITIDGVDGSGKSTQIEFIRTFFADRNIPLVVTREPGGTKVGENIRSQLLTAGASLSLETEALLMFASRQQHLQELIYPCLSQGTWVLSDRFTEASYAYQGAGGGLSQEKISILENWVQGDFRPDLTIIVDTPIDIARGRISGDKDRIESREEIYFENVRHGFLRQAAAHPDRCRVVDGAQMVAQVSHDIAIILVTFLEQQVE